MSPELRDLLDGYCEGTLDRPGIVALRHRLETDPLARQAYRLYMDVHADLLWRSRAAAPVKHPAFIGRSRFGALSGRVIRFAVAAMIVLGLIGVMSLLVTFSRPDRAGRVGPPIATLIDADHAQWDPGDLPTEPGSPLPGGYLHLRSGKATVEFYSGAQVMLTGPSDLGLNSAGHAFLRRGTISVYCPKPARGFTVSAPGCSVVDLGTRLHNDQRRDVQADPKRLFL